MKTGSSCSTMKRTPSKNGNARQAFMGCLFDGKKDVCGGDVYLIGGNLIYLHALFDDTHTIRILENGRKWSGYQMAGVGIGGSSGLFGHNVWSDGVHYYITNENNSEYDGGGYALSDDGSTIGADVNFTPYYEFEYNGVRGDCIWTDGSNIYHSYGMSQLVWNTQTQMFEPKDWGDIRPDNGGCTWTDGDNIYYSGDICTAPYKTEYAQLVLNKSTGLWENKTWNIPDFYGASIWSDGSKIYLGKSYCLEDDSWVACDIEGLPSNFDPNHLVVDGEFLYYLDGETQLVMIPENAAVYSNIGGSWQKIGNLA